MSIQKDNESINIEKIFEIIIRRRWVIILPFCISIVIGTYCAFTFPKLYSASTLILIEPQKVPTNYVNSIVPVDMDARIRTLSQQILSRTNLEKIIKKCSLFSGSKYKDMYLIDKVESLRSCILIDVTQDRSVTDAFSISHVGKDKIKVMQVANLLASFFIDENLKIRESQAVGTSDFLKTQLDARRKKLERLEESLKKYRKKHMGELPEQLETNLRGLDRLQEQLRAKQDSLRDLNNRLVALEGQTQDIRSVSAIDSSTGRRFVVDELPTLSQLEAQLADLRSRYTEKHPDIVRLKKMIVDMEIMPEQKGIESQELTGRPRPGRNLEAVNYRNEIKKLKVEIAEFLKQIKIYQKRVENTPKREQELMSLKRDYNNIQDSYNSLLGTKLDADIAVSMEKKQKGEKFRILDPAMVPEKPVSPDLRKIFLVTIVAGLALGCGLVFLLERIDTSFRKPEEIEDFYGISVIASIPTILNDNNERMRKCSQFLNIISVVFTLCLFFCFAVLTLITGVD